MSTNSYLELDKIKGEAVDNKHKDWIELFSFTHGVTQPASGSGGTGGQAAARADFQSFCVTKFVEASSPDLHIYCAGGTHIAKATVEVCQETGGQAVYWKYDFKNLMVQSVSVGGGGSDRPTESVCFVYDEIKWTYTAISREGQPTKSIDRTWSLEKNKKM